MFLPIFTKPDLVKHWIGFNSYRKILPIADGSLLKSTINLPKELINNTEPEFVYIKDSAKIKKFEYLNYNRHSQEEYIRLFKLAENSLNNQKTAHKISTKSLIWLINSIDNFEKEYSTRNENFITLDDSLRVISNIRKPKHPSFYVINVDKRDALRKHLASENIYLPVHWPKPNMVDHPLYNRLISIPVDSRYNLNDMNKVADNIKRFYNI